MARKIEGGAEALGGSMLYNDTFEQQSSELRELMLRGKESFLRRLFLRGKVGRATPAETIESLHQWWLQQLSKAEPTQSNSNASTKPKK